MNKTAKIISAAVAFAAAAGLGTAAYMTLRTTEGVPIPIVETDPTEAPTEAPTLPLYDEYVSSPKGLTGAAKVMLKKNKDYAGWITIDNTYVDYPVFMDPGEIPEGQSYYGNQYYGPNSFYLHSSMNRNYDFGGSLFIDYRDDFGAVEEEQSENIIIYGHNMLNLTMFGSLRQYYNDYEFWKSASFIRLSSNYADYDYVVCGNCVTSGYSDSDFLYWNMEDLSDEEDFNFYFQKLKEKQRFDTGVDVKYGDKLVTLSTCYGATEDNNRFILVARRLREGEIAGEMSTIERTEEYKQKQAETEKEEKEQEQEKEDN